MKNILVIQTGKLGDTVCTTPVFRAIKEKYPNALLTVCGDGVSKEVLRGNNRIDEYVLVNELTREKIKELKLDVAIILGPNPDMLFKLLISRIPKIIAPKITGGFSPYATKKYRILLNFVTQVEHRMHHYAPQEYLNMLRPLGIISSNTQKELSVESDAEKKIENLLSANKGKKVGIAPGAGNKIKEWSPENFNLIAKFIIEKGYKVILIGGPQDKDLGEVVKVGISNDDVLDSIGSITIEELKALVKNLDLFISVDTGPIYIAEAFKVPTVDIIGPMDECEQPPNGELNRLVYLRDRKSPAIHIMNARLYDKNEARRQIEMITPGMVIAEIKDLFAKLDNKI